MFTFYFRCSDDSIRPASCSIKLAKLIDSRDILFGCDGDDLTVLIPVDGQRAGDLCQCVLVLFIGF
jgi:hypothetical protein